MGAVQAVETVFSVPRRLDAMVAELRRECVAIEGQWDALGSIGGQREDHAAGLLKALRTHLHAIATTATRMDEQIGEIMADPFAD